MNNRIFRYLLIAIGWTWGCWIGAMLLSASMGHVLSTDQTIFELVRSFTTSEAVLPQVLFALGVYGPLLGYLAVRPVRTLQRRGGGGMTFIWMAILIPIILVVPVVLLSMLTGIGRNGEGTVGNVPAVVALYFLSNLVTSGTEEFGWRGIPVPPSPRKGEDFLGCVLERRHPLGHLAFSTPFHPVFRTGSGRPRTYPGGIHRRDCGHELHHEFHL